VSRLQGILVLCYGYTRERREDILVVCEFEDVFPEELPGLLPQREINFKIELIPESQPSSRAPHHMAQIELKELKI